MSPLRIAALYSDLNMSGAKDRPEMASQLIHREHEETVNDIADDKRP